MLELLSSSYRQSASGLRYIDSRAKGECYVLLHGISSGAASWVKQFSTVGDQHRLIAWDAPGYGGSHLLATSTPTAVDYAAALDQLMIDADIQQPITLVGHSLGAMVAAAYAARYGDKVKRLVLVNPAQGYAFSDDEKKAAVYGMRPALLTRLGNDGMAEERGPNLLAQKTEFNMEVVRTVTRGISLAGLTGTSYLLAYDSIERYLSEIHVDTALFYGEKDGITPPAGMFTLQNKFPFLHLHAIADAGHLAYLDQPEAFNALLFNEK